MTLVQYIRLQKDFAEWCKQHRIPATKRPAYGARVFAFYRAAWMRGGCRK
jgi:hypothetical protein